MMRRPTSNKEAVRVLVENWAESVRRKDIAGIIANHSKDMVMYDVPPPFKSVGIDAYKETWSTFYGWTRDDEVIFDIVDLNVVAGDQVAFCYADMRCAGYSDGVNKEPLDFRLTIGLEKVEGEWLIVHEHHSIPAE